jgi:hypothetical protein
MLRRSVSLSLLPRMHRAIASYGPVQLQQGRTCRELPVKPMLLQATTNQDSNAEPAHEEPNAVATASAAAAGHVEGLQTSLDESRRAVTDVQAKLDEVTAAAAVDRSRADDLQKNLDESRRTITYLRTKLGEETAAAIFDGGRADRMQKSLDESRRAVTDLQAAVYREKAHAYCLQKNAAIDHRAVTPGAAATSRTDVDSTKARRTAWSADWTSGLTFVLWSAALATGAFYTGQRAAETTAATPMTPHVADAPTNVRCVDPSGSRMPETRATTATTQWATQLHYWMLYVSTMALAFVMCAAFHKN